MIRLATLLLAVTALVGCAGKQQTEQLSTEHPAHPDAATTPLPVLSASLTMEEKVQTDSDHGAGQDHAAHQHQGHDNVPAATTQSKDEKATYLCPMHPEVKSDKPSKCPICGMNLVKKN